MATKHHNITGELTQELLAPGDNVNTNSISSEQKEEILEQMEMSRDMRLAFVPELRKQSDVPVITLGL